MKIREQIKLVICSISMAGLVTAGTMVMAGTVPETFDIDIQKECSAINGLPKNKKIVPNFSHKAHAERYLKGNEKYAVSPYTDEFTCSACHTGAKDKASLDREMVCSDFEKAFESHGGVAKFQNYFHKSCKGCHKAMKKDGLKTGPVSCKGCHVKR